MTSKLIMWIDHTKRTIAAPAIKAEDGGRIVMKGVKYSGGVETADIDLCDFKN